jgi:hypothetical protein
MKIHKRHIIGFLSLTAAMLIFFAPLVVAVGLPNGVEFAHGSDRSTTWRLSISVRHGLRCLGSSVGESGSEQIGVGCEPDGLSDDVGLPHFIETNGRGSGSGLLVFFVNRRVERLKLLLRGPKAGRGMWVRAKVTRIPRSVSDSAGLRRPIDSVILARRERDCIERIITVGVDGRRLNKSPRVICSWD